MLITILLFDAEMGGELSHKEARFDCFKNTARSRIVSTKASINSLEIIREYSLVPNTRGEVLMNDRERLEDE